MNTATGGAAPGRVEPAQRSVRARIQAVFGGGVATTAGVNVVTTAMGSISGVFLARSLGATDRGSLVTVMIWPSMISSLASLGITQATCYWVSRRRPAGAPIARIAARAALITGLLVAGGGAIVAPVIAGDGEVIFLLRVVLVMSPVFIAAGVWMSALQAVAIRAWNQARAVQPLVYFTGIVGLAVSGRLTLTSATAVFCCSLVVQLGYAWLRSKAILDASEPAGQGVVRDLYRFGSRVWLANVPRLVNVRFDQLLLSVLPAVAAAELGVYAVAASLSTLALPAAVAFGSVAFPSIAGSRDEAEIRRIERVSLTGSAGVAAGTLLVACVVAPWMVPLLFGAEFDEAVVCLWLLAPGTVFLAINRVLADILQGRGRPLSTSVGEGGATILTVALLAVLVPPFGIRGAAAASSIAYLGASVLLYGRLRAIRRTSARTPSEAIA